MHGNAHFARFLLAAVFTAAAPAFGDASCPAHVTDPVSDICWDCVLPITVGGARVAGSGRAMDTDAPAICECTRHGSAVLGLNVSFNEPVRTIEIVRHPWCFPTLGGATLSAGRSAPAHGRTPNALAVGSRTAFWQVHWFVTPWLFLLEALLDTSCLEQSPWDLAYVTELDPLWDDPVSSFVINPDAALFASGAALGACAADCAAATAGAPRSELYWCAGCQGGLFPLTGWVGAYATDAQAWMLLAERFTMKMHREGAAWAAYGKKGQCGPYLEPIMNKAAYRIQMLAPGRSMQCLPFGASTAPLAGKTWSPGGEDAVFLVWRRRDCCQGASL